MKFLAFLICPCAVLAILAGCQGSTSEPPPKSPSFVFAAAGDFGSVDSAATLELMSRSGAQFVLALGDLSYRGASSESTWCDFVKSKIGNDLPFELISGNHEDDYGEDGHIDNFAACLPDRLGVHGRYPQEYYFDYQGLARFIMISPDLTIDKQHYYYGDGNDHYNWVSSTIDEARGAKIPWVIVGMHKPCLSVGAYYCNIYADLFNLLIEKRVDLVLQAHEHNYQRSKQLASSAACPAVPVDSFNGACVTNGGNDGVYPRGAGTILVIAGTGGGELYDASPDDSEAGYFAKWMGANVNPRKGFMRYVVTSEEIRAEFVGSTATSDFADRFAIRGAKN